MSKRKKRRGANASLNSEHPVTPPMSPDRIAPSVSPVISDGQTITQPVPRDGQSPTVPQQESWYEKARTKAFLDMIQKIVFIIGVPVGIYTYFDTHDKERRDRERATYEKLDDRYWDYIKLSTNFPLLHVTDATHDPVLQGFAKDRSKLTPEERIRERQIMYLLIALHERAFVMYHDQSTAFKKQEWEGWQRALQRWLDQEVFLEAWRQIGVDFDENYVKHVNALIEKKAKTLKK